MKRPPDYCTDPKNYRIGGRKHILWLAFLEGGEIAVLAANRLLAKPVKEITFGNWFWQWPMWKTYYAI